MSEQITTPAEVNVQPVETQPTEQVVDSKPTPEDIYAKYYKEPEPLITPAPPDLSDTINSLKQEIVELKTSLSKPAEMSPAEKQDFIGLLKDGKIREAEEYLATRAADKSSQIIEQRIAKMQEEMTQRSKFESRVNDFVSVVKQQNPDLLPFEELITTKASTRLDQELKSGRIRSQEDLFRAYQKAVLDEVSNTKQLIQTIRGDGKQEALTTRKEVLSSSPVRPSPVTSSGELPPKDDQKPMTVTDYLAERQNRMKAQKGMAGV